MTDAESDDVTEEATEPREYFDGCHCFYCQSGRVQQITCRLDALIDQATAERWKLPDRFVLRINDAQENVLAQYFADRETSVAANVSSYRGANITADYGSDLDAPITLEIWLTPPCNRGYEHEPVRIFREHSSNDVEIGA